MCKWKNLSDWVKELLGLLISGFIIILFMWIVVVDLKGQNEPMSGDMQNGGFSLSFSNSGSKPAGVTDHTFSQVSIMSSDNLSADRQHHYEASVAGPIGELIPFLGRLSFLDILILVFIWPVGVFFNKFARNISDRLYSKYFKQS